MDKKSQLGYSENSPYKDEPYININSNKITMKNTTKDLIGLGIKDGKIVKIQPMKAKESEDYDFGDVDSVLEIPNFQGGGFNGMQFNQRQVQNGYNQGRQLDPINWEPISIGGQDPFADFRTGVTGNPVNQPQERVERLGNPQDFIFNSLNSGRTGAGQTEGTQEVETQGVDTPASVATATTTPTNTNIGAEPKVDSSTTERTSVGGAEVDDFLAKDFSGNIKPYEKVEEEKTRFTSPYGGVSLDEAFAGFGRGVRSEENDGLTALYGLKAGIGSIRNFMGGYSSQAMSEYVDDEAERKAKEQQFSRWLQNGGVLSGVDLAELQSFQEGGQMGMPKKLTGDFTEGLANKNPEQAVAEVEDKEFILHNNGQIVEVLGNTHEKGGEKMTANQLQDGDRVVSNHLKFKGDTAKKLGKEFGIKINSKDTYADGIRKVRNEIGLTKLIQEKEDIIKSIEKTQQGEKTSTSQLNLQFQSGKLQELQKKEEGLKAAFNTAVEKIYEVQEASKPKKPETGKMEHGGEHYNTGKEGLKAWYEEAKKLGFNGEIDFNAKDLGAEAGKVQRWMAENKPQAVVKYFTEKGNAITNKGVEMLKKSHPEMFKAAGIDPNGELSQEDRIQLQTKFIESGKATDDFWVDQFQDDLWAYRAPNPFQDMTGDDLSALKLLGSDVDLSNYLSEGQKDKGERPVGDPNPAPREDKGSLTRLPNLPDQSVMPPDAMAGHLKNNYRFNRVEPGKVSPEQALANIGSQFETATDQADQRPDSMRAALLAQMLAGSQTQSNQAVTTANTANQNSVNQAENYNAQVGDKEMYANNSENLRFEQIQMRAKDNTNMDWRDYNDYNRKVALNNYNTVNQMNLVNEMFDKYEFVNGEARLKSGDSIESLMPAMLKAQMKDQGK